MRFVVTPEVKAISQKSVDRDFTILLKEAHYGTGQLDAAGDDNLT